MQDHAELYRRVSSIFSLIVTTEFVKPSYKRIHLDVLGWTVIEWSVITECVQGTERTANRVQLRL